jgi:membrane-associated phospholipid phosphatase
VTNRSPIGETEYQTCSRDQILEQEPGDNSATDGAHWSAEPGTRVQDADIDPCPPTSAPGPVDKDAIPARSPWILIRRRPMLTRIVLAAALVAIATLTNRSYLGWGLFVVFGILFVPVSRARSFVLSFVPYGAVWFVFTALRSLADETLLARTVNLRAANFERFLFDGQLPTVTLQQRFFDPGNLHWWDYALTGVHWSYFFVPHIVAIHLWHRHPAIFKHFLASMTLLLAVGLGIYFLIPSNPPWLAGEQFNSPAAPTVLRVMHAVGEQLGGGVYQASYRVIGESNPIAAMPSIHMAITFLLVFPARRLGRRWGLLAWAYSTAMGLALVYLGEHYVIDVVVGMAVAAYGWYTAGAWRRRLRLISEHQRQRAAARARRPVHVASR